MILKLSDIFFPNPDKYLYTKQELFLLTLKKEFITEIAKELDLIYLEANNNMGNLCFITNEQIRPEFKLFFSKEDVLQHLDFTLKKEDNIDIYSYEIQVQEMVTLIKQNE